MFKNRAGPNLDSALFLNNLEQSRPETTIALHRANTFFFWHDATTLLGLHVMPVSLNTEILSVLRQTSILTIKYFVFGNESRRVELADGRPTARCGGIHFRG